jgi:predicted metal-binding membrane protein
VVLRGSATKTVKVVRTSFVGFATAATNILFTYKKHTTANTAGTSTNPAAIQRDSTDAAPTALLLLYTAAPTINGSAAIVANVWTQLAVTMATASVLPLPVVQDYGLGPYEDWVLNGVAQEFAINFNSVAVPAGALYTYEITWTEE